MDKFFFRNINTIVDDSLNNSCDLESKNCFQSFFDSSNFKRDYSKGKSFKFSIWNELDTYNNDDFVQDFVQYDQKLWACISTTPLTNVVPEYNPDGTGPWQLVMEGVSDIEFKQDGNTILWKYQDDSTWRELIELDVVSTDDVKQMLSDLEIEFKNIYDSELSDTSVNAVQNKVITEVLKGKVDVEKNKGLSSNDFSDEEKDKLSTIERNAEKNVIPDWDAQEGEAGYIENRTHYTTQIPLSTNVDTFIEDFPKYYDSGVERYYSEQDVDILYTEDGDDYLLTIPANTLLGYENNNNIVDIEINSEGEIFQFESHSDMGDIFIKVKRSNAGNNFRVVLYTQLDEKFIPDTIARKSELTELSEGIALRNVGAEDTDESVDEPEIGGGGASTDKQGVVSQTLNYNTADNTYSVSNVVRGSIPSFFIDLVTEAGASFNAESGYFSLNGIDNIAYDEMRQIYDCRTGYGVNSLLAVYGNTYTARTNFAAFRSFGLSYSNHQPTTFYTKYLCSNNASITKFVIHNEGIPLYVRADSVNNFEGLGTGYYPILRSRLEEIIGIIDVTNLTGSANFFYNGTYQPWLTSFQLKSLKASIDLSGMPRLSEDTILYMINNEKAASAITIKLHADAKAMADASEAIQSALENHANITLGV